MRAVELSYAYPGRARRRCLAGGGAAPRCPSVHSRSTSLRQARPDPLDPLIVAEVNRARELLFAHPPFAASPSALAVHALALDELDKPAVLLWWKSTQALPPSHRCRLLPWGVRVLGGGAYPRRIRAGAGGAAGFGSHTGQWLVAAGRLAGGGVSRRGKAPAAARDMASCGRGWWGRRWLGERGGNKREADRWGLRSPQQIIHVGMPHRTDRWAQPVRSAVFANK